LGYVIRDENGEVIRAGAGRSEYVYNAMHSELLACFQGVKAAHDEGIQKIDLETDAFR